MRTIAYEDRLEAAAALCELLPPLAPVYPASPMPPQSQDQRGFKAQYDCVLGLCRGGVPVAAQVASHLSVPLEVLIVRKLGAPSNPELAMGALVEGGTEVLNEDVLRWIPHPEESLALARAREGEELRRRAALYRGGRPPMSLQRRRVLIVDDGAATGATAKAAIRAARARGASVVDIALPVAPPETCIELSSEADNVICPWKPACFLSVGNYYRHFPQVSDAEVKRILQNALQATESQPARVSLPQRHVHA